MTDRYPIRSALSAMREWFCLLAAGLLLVRPVSAHHGVASMGVAGLQGPGAPVESSSSATLPAGKSLAYFKMDQARWQTYSTQRNNEKDVATFFMAGGGYGFAPYLSVYTFIPYNAKTVRDNSYNTAGFADLSLMGVLGFKYDEGFRLLPETESLDDLEDWHFALYGGGTIPTGTPNVRDSSGRIDPAMSPGFGSPSYIAGLAASKMWGRFTWIHDTSLISFDPCTYADGVRYRFGAEIRYNMAFTYNLITREASRFRFDPVLEFNFVSIAPDSSRGMADQDRARQLAALLGIPLADSPLSPVLSDATPPWRVQETLNTATSQMAVPSLDAWGSYAQTTGMKLEPSGGRILYTLVGMRFYKESVSFAAGVKTVISSEMNRIPVSRTLSFAYLQGSQTGDPPGAVADAWWNQVAMEKRLFQGSEGRERYRLILSMSVLL